MMHSSSNRQVREPHPPGCWRWPVAGLFRVNSGGRQRSHVAPPGRWACSDRTSSAGTEQNSNFESDWHKQSTSIGRQPECICWPSVPWSVRRWCCRTGRLSSSSRWCNQGRAPCPRVPVADLETEQENLFSTLQCRMLAVDGRQCLLPGTGDTFSRATHRKSPTLSLRMWKGTPFLCSSFTSSCLRWWLPLRRPDRHIVKVLWLLKTAPMTGEHPTLWSQWHQHKV